MSSEGHTDSTSNESSKKPDTDASTEYLVEIPQLPGIYFELFSLSPYIDVFRYTLEYKRTKGE
jgi:hypothetical protein